MPEVTDFSSDNEVIVWPAPGQVPDSLGRIQFTAFWLDPACVYGVRGQVFNTDLNTFVAREQAVGYPVTVTREAARG